MLLSGVYLMKTCIFLDGAIFTLSRNTVKIADTGATKFRVQFMKFTLHATSASKTTFACVFGSYAFQLFTSSMELSPSREPTSF